jgi:uncharacterized protein
MHAIQVRSDRAGEVVRLFDLQGAIDEPPEAIEPVAHRRALRSLLPAPGQVVLVTGASGGGKSSLLRRLRRFRARHRWIDVQRTRLPAVPTVDCFGPDVPVLDALKLLSRVGLGEAWTYLRTPAEISDGQRWRLRLALALRAAHRCEATRDPILVCDEFAALLDRITACVIARMLRRAVSAAGTRASAIVATSHEDLIGALQPDVIVTCDFGTIEVSPASRDATRRA